MGDARHNRTVGIGLGRSALACLALACLVAGSASAAARAAEVPEAPEPLAARQSTPPCSPECEVIDSPTDSFGSPEYEGSGPGGGFSPADLRAAYGLPASGGAGVTVAIVDDLGAPAAAADLAFYRSHFGLPPCTEASGCFRQVNERGEARKPASAGSWVGEISLDLDMVSAACPECRILLVEGHGQDGRVAAIAKAVEMGADVVSNSWNFGFEKSNPANSSVNCSVELCVSAAEEAAYDPSFDFPGVPIVFSGGDYGYAVRYPAASPNVIAVGGTRLLAASGSARGWSEEVWSNTGFGRDRKGRGTGSGCSVTEPKPAWQTDAACATRMTTDVSAVADPRSPVAVYDSAEGGWFLVGGTSAAAPFVAGVEGISSAGTRLRGAAAFWKAGAAGGLFDVTIGGNGECTPPADVAYWCAAGTGYDGPTGWGTPAGPLELIGPPGAVTEAASAVTARRATLNGLLDNEGEAGGSSCSFELTGAADAGFADPLATVPCEQPSVGGDQPTAVSASVEGLSPNTAYAYRLLAGNGEGEAHGDRVEFRTLPEPPVPTVVAAEDVSQTGAVLRGHVDNEAAPLGSTCVFEVAAAADTAFASPVAEPACDPALVEGDTPTAVAGALSGLQPGTAYIYRLVATSAGGTSVSAATGSVLTLPPPPAALTAAAGAVAQTTAALHGSLDGEGAPQGASCTFEITGAADTGFEAPLATVACDVDPVAGEESIEVGADATGLQPNTAYLYRLHGASTGGDGYGAAQSFRTLPEPPAVATVGVERVTETSATVLGSVAPDGVPVDGCAVQYGPSVPYAYEQPCTEDPGSGLGPVGVTAALEGLDPGTTYHFRFVARNGGGEAVGADQAFATATVPPVIVQIQAPDVPLPTGPAPALRILSARGRAAGALLRVAVPEAGELKATGKGMRPVRRAVGRASTVVLHLHLTARSLARLAPGASTRVRVRVALDGVSGLIDEATRSVRFRVAGP